MNILLVEPNYKNSYPPIGLMKISTFHKSRGDQVLFFKGIIDEEKFAQGEYERVYITTLFTFYYALSVDTIRAYQAMIQPNAIYVGGIMATLMPDRLRDDIGGETNLLTGLLSGAGALGLEDHCNIDQLPLDYSILDDVTYKYHHRDDYFSYITRGCTNKCNFCAVPRLEPQFGMTNNIATQIQEVNERYGEKQNLRLMDNNILSLSVEELTGVVNDLATLGYGRESGKYVPPLPFDVYITKLNSPMYTRVACVNILTELVLYLQAKQKSQMSSVYRKKYDEILKLLAESNDPQNVVQAHTGELHEILAHGYHTPGRRRFVDFNQGIDARQLTEDKMRVLARLQIEPFRLAFDNIKYTETYKKALRLAAQYGVTSFSNYLLFNLDDKPEELWQRLKINIDLVQEHEKKIRIFSFPMKYAPIDEIDRSHIGQYWCKKYLSNFQAIINVTRGIVADGEEFFYRAFGKDTDEFYEILCMPREMVIYRQYFEDNGMAAQWRVLYRGLCAEEKDEFLACLKDAKSSSDERIRKMLEWDKVKKMKQKEGEYDG